MKYEDYIEIKPGYESVIDIGSDERNKNLWQDYIVHDDMKNALHKIVASFKNEDPNERRSFWIYGTYGTGKSYAAIVIKHLFTDTIQNISGFFDQHSQLNADKNAFLGIRQQGKGDFLVIWETGVTGIRNGIDLMMKMEIAIRKALKEKFGEQANYGRESLLSSIQKRVADDRYNWEKSYKESSFKSPEYDSFAELMEEVNKGDLDALDITVHLCREMHISLLDDVDSFQNWIKEIIEVNGLSDKGIVFIWDEFTDFVNNAGNDNILQRLSEYCKEQPFFMFLIVHRTTALLNKLGEDNYKRIMHRYHELQFSISQTAAADMIADTITIRPGMEESWKAESYKMIQDPNIQGKFDVINGGFKDELLRRLVPLHPTTVSLLADVSQSFAASSRTLFSFMKDASKVESKQGFIHFIKTQGPDGWRWLTVDYLWDYFFTEDSDLKGFSPTASRAFRLYQDKVSLVTSNEISHRVFKAALLLISIFSTEKLKIHRAGSAKLDCTKKTLIRCFAGQLSNNQIEECLTTFNELNIIKQWAMTTGDDFELQLPYAQSEDKYEEKLEEVKKTFTRRTLCGDKQSSDFGNRIAERMWSDSDPCNKRMVIKSCSKEDLELRRIEILKELEKPYKFALIVVITEATDLLPQTYEKAKEVAAKDTSGRFAICVLKNPLDDKKLNQWWDCKTRAQLASDAGSTGTAQEMDSKMQELVSEWTEETVQEEMTMFYGDNTVENIYGANDFAKRYKNNVIFAKFPFAPEKFVELSTVYKSSSINVTTAAVTRQASQANIKTLQAVFESSQAWKCKTIEELKKVDDTPAGTALGELASLIDKKLNESPRTSLNDLWNELQESKFGMFDNMVSAYMIALVFSLYENSKYSWVDSQHGSFPFTKDNIARLSASLCNGKLFGDTITAGSEVWQRFKKRLQKLFDLDESSVQQEPNARRNLNASVQKSGTPLWSLKYVDAGVLGGENAKVICCKLVDEFSSFLLDHDGKQTESIAGNVEDLIKSFGSSMILNYFHDGFNDKKLRQKGLQEFIITSDPEIKELAADLDITTGSLIDELKKNMQTTVAEWTEIQVKEKLSALADEYRLTKALCDAMESEQNDLCSLTKDIKQALQHMKVPGKVIENMSYDWVDGLKALNEITYINQNLLTSEEKKNLTERIQVNGKKAWQNILSYKVLLADYMKKEGIECSDNDLETVFNSIPDYPYNTPEPVFKASINKPLDAMEMTQNKIALKSIWKKISGTDSVKEWCIKYNIPIQWVAPVNDIDNFYYVRDVTENQSITNEKLLDAINYFSKGSFDYLQDEKIIEEKFCEQIGEEHKQEFLDHKKDIIDHIRAEVGPNPFTWANVGSGRINSVIKSYMAPIYKKKAKEELYGKIQKMDAEKLRENVLKMLDENPQLSVYFSTGN